jgi:crotonobetainyl-CoA:carnitine CoA-transferase CaiB-like acyl-CoA transferase
MKFATRQAPIDRAAPLLGEHTDELLREFLGYDAAKLSALRADKIIR